MHLYYILQCQNRFVGLTRELQSSAWAEYFKVTDPRMKHAPVVLRIAVRPAHILVITQISLCTDCVCSATIVY